MRTYNVYDTLDMLYMRMYNICEKLIYIIHFIKRTKNMYHGEEILIVEVGQLELARPCGIL